MNKHLISYYIGIFIVFASHLYILYSQNNYITMTQHTYGNILAGVLIAYYFMYKEEYIKF